MRLAGNATGKCSLPDVPLPKPLFGGNCIQPIIWTSTTVTGHASLRDPGSKVYSALPPKPKHEGRWVGYYLEAHFASDTGLKEDFVRALSYTSSCSCPIALRLASHSSRARSVLHARNSASQCLAFALGRLIRCGLLQIFTTPGWTFPNTLPFADCTGEECRGHPL